MQDIHAYFSALAEDWNVKLLGGSVLAFCADFFGNDWWLIGCLFYVLLADLALGLTCALRFDGRLSWRKLHDGIIKFLAYAVSIVMVWLVQQITLHSIPVDLPILAVFAGYQSLTEIKSVTRHLERLGLTMPALLHRMTTGAEQKMDKAVDEALPRQDKRDSAGE